jgi:hypothetical protein
MKKILITILLIYCFFPYWLDSIEVKAERKITLSQESDFIHCYGR